MTHKGSGVLIAPGAGNPGTEGGIGGLTPVTRDDLNALRDYLVDLINTQADPLFHRQIQNIDIVNATIQDAKIGSISADKITTGTLQATTTITVSGNLETAASGPRVVISPTGIELYDGSTRTVFLDAATGDAEFSGDLVAGNITGNWIPTTGAVTSATSGSRVIIDTSGVRSYDSGGIKTFDLSTTAGQVDVIRSDGLDNILADSYSSTAANGARIIFRRARGSLASPSGISSGDNILELGAVGRTSAGAFSGSVGGLVVKASENFGASANGAKIDFLTTLIGATASKVRWSISDRGELQSTNEGSNGNAAVISFDQKSDNPGGTSQPKLYAKGNKLVVTYDDSGTQRYFTLDLTQSGATPVWAQSTTGP